MTYRVLLVEDDPMVLMINQRYVEAVDDFEVVGSAQTISEAQSILTEQTIDLVLIDLSLKNESGLELAKWIRSQDIQTEFMIISAENHTKTIELTVTYGAVDYILKPFNADRLRQSLNCFKQKSELLSDHDTMTQADLDALYGQVNRHQIADEPPLEKGISRHTLNHVLEIIKTYQQPFDIESIVKISGLSHVTVRKYIQFLVDHQILKEEMEYGSIGRPTTKYSHRM